MEENKEVSDKTQCDIKVHSVCLWMQGFSASGQSQGASMLGTYQAVDLDDAVKQYIKQNKSDVDWDRFGRGIHAIWGCKLFDNEAEARKSFG